MTDVDRIRADVKVKPAKGRPMLTWVGKRPLSHITAYPAQHVETYDPTGDASRRGGDTWGDWPSAYPKGGLLFHGDNKDVLAHLLANGFRGKVKLVCIDPPFDSGADYVRKVNLRGIAGTAKLDGETYTLGEQIQYTDIWANDNYLQFMYERLLLLRELLAEDGSIYLHCDDSKSHHLRCLLDEVFGAENFMNSIVWYFSNKPQFSFVSYFPRDTQTIHVYAKNVGRHTFHHRYVENKRERKQNVVTWDAEQKKRVSQRDSEGKVVYRQSTERLLGCMWDIPMVNPAGSERAGFPTQKPEALLEGEIHASSGPDDLVLDCFIGSGTTAVVAQRMGRRWIACDINKGAIQATMRRLMTVTEEQIANHEQSVVQPALLNTDDSAANDVVAPPAQLSFAIYRVNDYDLRIQHNEAVNLACDYLGIVRTRSDAFFDGALGKRLAKIIPFGHPLTPLDMEEVRRELSARPDEGRDIVLVCLGKELAVDAWLEDWNRMRQRGDVPNKIEVIELRTDPRYGGFFAHQPADGRVSIERAGDLIRVRIADFVSPSILERLKTQAGVLAPQIDDWRAMVDSVMIDTAYDGQVFNVVLADVPEKKTDLVAGAYELPAPSGETTVAVKITDMLGEEVLKTVTV